MRKQYVITLDKTSQTFYELKKKLIDIPNRRRRLNRSRLTFST
jgi:hypothetical protein